jgi:hypothetical protein
MAGLFAAYSIKERKTLHFLIAGLLGIAPDFDAIFRIIGIDNIFIFGHRQLSHTIFPTAFLVGFLTLWLFKSYWLGALAYLTHPLLDALDSSVYWTPWTSISLGKYSLIDMMGAANYNSMRGVVVSAAIATALLLILIYIEYRSVAKEKKQTKDL